MDNNLRSSVRWVFLLYSPSKLCFKSFIWISNPFIFSYRWRDLETVSDLELVVSDILSFNEVISSYNSYFYDTNLSTFLDPF